MTYRSKMMSFLYFSENNEYIRYECDNFAEVPDKEQVKTIDIRDCNLENLEGIEEFANAESLVFYNADIGTLNGIEYLPHLKSFTCEKSAILDIWQLSNCYNLEDVCITYSDVDFNEDSFLNCSQIKILDIDCTLTSTLKFLKHLPNLSSLYCDETRIKSLEGVENCRKLQSLSCDHANITNLDTLRGLDKLTYLSCIGCWNLVSIDGLEGCISINEISISLSRNVIKLPKVLMTLPKLTSLVMDVDKFTRLKDREREFLEKFGIEAPPPAKRSRLI